MVKRLSPPPWLLAAIVAVLVCCLPAVGLAQDAAAAVPAETAAAAAEITKPDKPAPAIDTGSTAWMLVSAALVLLMVPGLALFYGGMARVKNILNTLLMVMVCCGLIGVLWVGVGYAFVFPVVSDQNKIIHFGSAEYTDAAGQQVIAPRTALAFDPALVGLSKFNSKESHLWDDSKMEWVDNPNYIGAPIVSGDTYDYKATGVPEIVFAMFQGMFAILTAALIIGSVVERVRFLPMLVFLGVWSLVVYMPVAHMVWNVNGVFFQMGVMDFAGGTVVHLLAGVSALALCLVVGPRSGYGSRKMPPHSLGLTLVGAGLLWFGWFGFNAGSAIAVTGGEHPVAGAVAALAFANTQTAAAAAAFAWMLVEWIRDGKPTILGFASGMIAGLVVITPCAGHVTIPSAMLIGTLGGAVCYFGCQLKKVFRYDDSLDAFGVHGVGGLLGAILVGVFAFRPGPGNVVNQAIAALIAGVFAFVVSYGLALLLKNVMGLRASEAEEETGLDNTLHGESGYNLSTIN